MLEKLVYTFNLQNQIITCHNQGWLI